MSQAEVMQQGEVEDGLFDAEPYSLPIPKLDGHTADRLVLAFGGSVELDRLVDEDLRIIELLLLGRDVRFVVEATVAGKGFSHAARRDEEEQVGYTVKLRVHSVSQ
jgi:hypothetical protein